MALKALYDTDRLFIRVHVYVYEWVRCDVSLDKRMGLM
jgi:hypothetical protein